MRMHGRTRGETRDLLVVAFILLHPEYGRML
jgi:hypothetical protein